ncbi:MAG TPA: hypothetical protein VGM79_00795 [Streptosporangiaceae bacterium]
MTEPPDDLDTWLARDVQPLAPRPGTFERIHRRARRRKLNQALAAAAGAVVVIAGAVLIPAAATGLLSGGGSGPAGPAAAGGHSSTPVTSSSAPPSVSASSSGPVAGSPGQSSTGLSATTSGAPAPAGFQPTSITMISNSIGAVIGQAGTPGHCGPPVAADCTSLAGTSDYGTSWYGVSAPVTPAPDGGTGVSQLRFLNLSDGWAYGPALYATADGGRHWTVVPTFGLRVTALEAAGNRAFVLLASCRGSGPAYAGDCQTFSLYSAAAGAATLQQVPLSIPGALQAGALGTASQAWSASLAIKGNAASPDNGTGYLYAPSGDILSGPVGGGAWSYAGKAPCAPGGTAGSGAPQGGELAVGAGVLLLDCPAPGAAGPGQLWESADGAQWDKVAAPGGTGEPRSLAATSAGRVVLATTTGILSVTLPDPGAWHSAPVAGGVPAGGFSYVGMTSPAQGVALPANAALGEVFVTRDGGQTWAPHQV